MILGVRNVYYNVMDLNASIDFYSKVLGLRVVIKEERWASLELSGVRVGLFWTGGTVVEKSPRGQYGSLIGATLSLTSSDLEEDRKKLEKAGTKICGEMEESFGKVVLFEDPDGNILRLVQPAE